MRIAAALTLSLLGTGALVVAAVSGGCREDRPACYAGDHQACTCVGGGSGYQGCLEEEERFGVCVCDGTTPGLDGSFEAGATEAAAPDAKVPFLGVCVANEDCATGVCFTFNAKGTLCSHACKTEGDCEPPSTGCNLQGICKAP
jgi:hypothetical protein